MKSAGTQKVTEGYKVKKKMQSATSADAMEKAVNTEQRRRAASLLKLSLWNTSDQDEV